MRTADYQGHKIVHQAWIFGKLYMFAYDVEHVLYMIKVNPDGTIDIL